MGPGSVLLVETHHTGGEKRPRRDYCGCLWAPWPLSPTELLVALPQGSRRAKRDVATDGSWARVTASCNCSLSCSMAPPMCRSLKFFGTLHDRKPCLLSSILGRPQVKVAAIRGGRPKKNMARGAKRRDERNGGFLCEFRRVVVLRPKLGTGESRGGSSSSSAVGIVTTSSTALAVRHGNARSSRKLPGTASERHSSPMINPQDWIRTPRFRCQPSLHGVTLLFLFFSLVELVIWKAKRALCPFRGDRVHAYSKLI